MKTLCCLRAFGAAAILVCPATAALAAKTSDAPAFRAKIEKFWSTPNVKLSREKKALCAKVPGGAANAWDALLGINGVSLEAGKNYMLRFDAVARGEGAAESVRVVFQEPVDPWTVQASGTLSPGGAMQPFALHVAAGQGGKLQLVFQLGGQAQSWSFCLSGLTISAASAGEAVAVDLGKQTPIKQDVENPIRLNQTGFFADGPKRATIISPSKTPVAFRLKDAVGALLGEGETEVRGLDTDSGYFVHVADFSAFSQVGDGYRLETDKAASHPFAIGDAAYRKLAVDALSWFYPQRSGIAIDGAVAGAAYARPAGHMDALPNLGDAAVACLSGEVARKLYGAAWTCAGPRDVRGGWYDAGDHGKYVVNGGIAVAQVMAAFERAQVFSANASPLLRDGYARLPESGNGLPDILDEARWELEFLLKMVVPEGDPLAGMAYHKVHDVQWTGLPLLPHLDPQPRALHRPSTAATLNLAAVAAQGARLFRPYDAAFADRLLVAAREAYEAARRHPDLFAPVSDGRQGGGDYDDRTVSDEFYWAAAELFITTGEPAFLKALRASPHWDGPVFDAAGFDWRSVAGFARLELGLFGTSLPDGDRQAIRQSIVAAAERFVELQHGQPFAYVYKTKSGRFSWGSNAAMLQNLLVIAAAYDLTGKRDYLQSAREGIDYLLGRNALDLSYVTGFGSVYSRQQHSRWYAHTLDASLPEPPVGSLAGGANETLVDPVAKVRLAGCRGPHCYIDDIGAWGVNEIAINWNAALVQFASFLADAR
ncbi:glycoside hydrolase family 9 protein [Rhizobium sp. LjRoot30]|uniref:glycoside hydrolase family 9 protein n=1 Tax=Rhizobium sp. LjRoot30 TaxID=3342320 RepID=UPI003ECD7F51